MKTPWLCAFALAGLLACQKSAPRPAEAKEAVAAGGARVIQMQVTPDGYVPARLEVKKGEPLELKITRVTNDTCATEIIIEGTNINTPLPYKEEVTIAWTPEKSGTVKYGCHMDYMISGVLVVE